jgi:hypothetical protein
VSGWRPGKEGLLKDENAHNLDAVMETFSALPYYDQKPRLSHI